MARVDIKQPREQAAHFGLYRTSAGGDESIIVRRKVGEPTDYVHTKSRKLKRQKENLALASQHYAHLTPSQKAITRHQFEEVEYQKSHGKTDTKLLMGRQLFISKEIRSLETTGEQLLLPHELCIMLVDAGLNPLEGKLWLRYLVEEEWLDADKEELAIGSWLFSQTPREQAAYRVEGKAAGFFDPKLPEHQSMAEDYLLTYHYHKLYPSGPYRSYSFSSRWWDFNSLREAYQPYPAIHLRSELTTYDFEGELIIGLKENTAPYPPDEWIRKQTYLINRTDPDPKYIYTTFSGIPIRQGDHFWITHQLVGNFTNLWSGIVRYYSIY